ncbi:hypothetical protein [Spirosoma lituiforme]
MNQPQSEKEKVTSQIAYYDDLTATYIDVIERLNENGTTDEAKILIGLANESIQHCQDKRAILISHLNTLSE